MKNFGPKMFMFLFRFQFVSSQFSFGQFAIFVFVASEHEASLMSFFQNMKIQMTVGDVELAQEIICNI